MTSTRTFANCLRHAEQELLEAEFSTADLHERLGRLCATGGRITANGHTYDASKDSILRGVEPVQSFIDWGCLERLSEFSRMRRAEMGEERWRQLEAEWEQPVEYV